MGRIVLVQAGAGTGKTTRITQEISDRIAAGLDPRRVVATTFTNKAAAELRSRIQDGILRKTTLAIEARLAHAEGLELALIGTVHSVGYRLLARYALPLGLAPRLEILEEDSQRRHLHDLLAEMDPAPWEGLNRVAARLSEDDPSQRVLELLDAKRSNAVRDDAFRSSMEQGIERLIRLIAPAGPDATLPPFDEFYDACDKTLLRLRAIEPKSKGTEKAIERLERLTAHRGTWSDWGDAASLEGTKKDRSDQVLANLVQLARRVARHPLLHEDLRTLNRLLVERVLDLEHRYDAYKRARGLMDFTDLEVKLLQMLDDPAIRADLAPSLGVVVVDEFQDTNPIQLAIFQRLAELAETSYWVGDEKQSIYGFRGTDPALVEAVARRIPKADTERLETNYRSQRGLVNVINAAFVPHFGADSKMKAAKDGPARVGRWTFDSRNADGDLAALAAGVHELVTTGTPSRHVAVLLKTNREVKSLGAHLKDAGIPCVAPVPGLLSTREGRAVQAALAVVADRHDTLAGAVLQHVLGDPTEATPSWLLQRVEELRADPPVTMPWKDAELLLALDGLSRTNLTPSGAVTAVIQALRLSDRVAAWGNAATRCANLDELCASARAYETDAAQSGKAPTLTGLLARWEHLADEANDYLPIPKGLDAVTVLTAHRVKGLEWPVVIVGALGGFREADPWTVQVEGGNAEAGRPLEGRTIRFWPWPFGRTPYGKLSGTQTGLEAPIDAAPEAIRLRGAGLREARRLLYVATTRAKAHLVLAHRDAEQEWLTHVPEFLEILPPQDGRSTRDLSALGLEYYTWDCRPVAPPPCPADTAWLIAAGRPATFVERYHSPSAAPAAEGVVVEAEALPGPHPFGAVHADDYERLGNAIHAYLAAIPSLRGLDKAKREGVAEQCLRRWKVSSTIAPSEIVEAGDRLEDWVKSLARPREWSTELVLSGPRDDGGQWFGFADLVLWGGTLAVVDHKTKPAAHIDVWRAKATEASGQLAAYRSILRRLGQASGMVHLPLGGGGATFKQ